MTARRLVLASASPARLRQLRSAGLDPLVMVSAVPEEPAPGLDTRSIVRDLAVRKATAVAQEAPPGAVVVGCDSLLDFGGQSFGKPPSAAEAAHRWRRMRGRKGTLCTGHCVIDTLTAASATDVAETIVHFGNPTDEELAAYVSTDEPLEVAGAFTLDGRSAPFIDGIEGDPGAVIGISLPLLRALLSRLSIEIVELWD